MLQYIMFLLWQSKAKFNGMREENSKQDRLFDKSSRITPLDYSKPYLLLAIIFLLRGKQLYPMTFVNKKICFMWSCKANIYTVVKPMNFYLVQIWMKSSEVSVSCGVVTKYCNFNTKIDSPPSANKYYL